MRKILILVIFATLLIGCIEEQNIGLNRDDNLTNVEALEEKIDALEKKIEEQNLENIDLTNSLDKERNGVSILKKETEKLKKENESLRYEKENFRNLSSLTLDFARARTTGDFDKLKSLVSNNIVVFYKDDEIWARYKDDESEAEYPLYFSRREKLYHDMHIIYYEYDTNKENFVIQTEEYFVNGEGIASGIGFVYLYFIKANDKWKIDRFEYDI